MKWKVITLVFFLFLLPVTSYAKYYDILSVDIDCYINQNSIVEWEEKRTFSFAGNYTFGYYDLPMTGYDWFRKIVVLENDIPYLFNTSKSMGTYWVEHLSDYHRIHFYYDATDEQRTFGYQYLIEGAITRFEDYGQFYWKMQGDRWGEPCDRFTARIHLEKPIPKDDYLVWVHGPLNGVVSKIDDQTILLKVSDVPAYSFVELRLLIPSTYFIEGKKNDSLIGPVALNEEAVWVKEANDIRKREIRLARKEKFWKWFWDILIYGLFLFFMFHVIVLYIIYGREFNLNKKLVYYREPPDIPPAELGYLLRFNKFHPYSIQAILLDLIRRKFIRIEEGEDRLKREIVLVKDDEKGIDGLTNYETTLMFEILFRDEFYQNQPQTTLSGLRKAIQKSPTRFYTPIEKFKRELGDMVKGRNFFDPISQKKASYLIDLSSLFLGIYILFGFVIPHSSLFLVLIPFCWIIGSKAVSRRSKKGKEIFDQSVAFKRFLQDFSQLNDYSANSVVIWEKFLVYAVILGVSKKVIDALEVKWNVLANDSNSNLFHSSSNQWIHSLSNLSRTSYALGSSINRVQRPVTRSYSSSGSSHHFSSFSGGGGGFSGGGGGGGGGSGGGMG